MPKITALEPQKRKGRLNVFVDGRFFVGVGEAVAARLRLVVGREIDSDRLREIVETEETDKAYESALRSLETRPRSEAEIRRKLTGAGFDPSTVDAVVDKLKHLGLLDDGAFASQWVEARTRAEASRPIGRRRIAQELFQKGIDKEIAGAVLGSVTDEDEHALALAAARKKVRSTPADPEAERPKLIAFLQRRGFGWSIVKRVTAEILGGNADDLDEPVND